MTSVPSDCILPSMQSSELGHSLRVCHYPHCWKMCCLQWVGVSLSMHCLWVETLFHLYFDKLQHLPVKWECICLCYANMLMLKRKWSNHLFVEFIPISAYCSPSAVVTTGTRKEKEQSCWIIQVAKINKKEREKERELADRVIKRLSNYLRIRCHCLNKRNLIWLLPAQP